VTGLAAVPSGTLVDKALVALAAGPQSADRLTRDVFGLLRAPAAVAERLSIALLGADPRIRRMADGRWGLVAAAAGSPLMDDCAFAVVDVETTGGRAGGSDRITEIAVVLVHGQRCEVVLETLVDPGRAIPPAVVRVTGITEQMVRRAPPFDEVADRVVESLAGRIFVAHNARFDWFFLSAELKRVRSLGLDGSSLCTVRLARNLLPGLPSYGLDSVSHYFGIQNRARHRAGGDALALGRVLQRLLELARGRGVRTLFELEQLSHGRKKKRRGKRRRSAPESFDH
jgi:DNA polymerase-3 subunit epsilon